MNTSELRPCKVSGRKGWFHRWANESIPLLKFTSVYSPERKSQIIKEYHELGIISDGATFYEIPIFYGIVEFEDGTIEKVSPEQITFLDTKPIEVSITMTPETVENLANEVMKKISEKRCQKNDFC